MARTAIPYSAFNANASTADPAGTTIDPTNGMVINNAVPEELVIRVANTAGATKLVTIKAGDYPPAIAAGQGDITGTVAATTGVLWFGPFEGRVMQNNGSIEIDFAASTAGTVTVFRVPRNA